MPVKNRYLAFSVSVRMFLGVKPPEIRVASNSYRIRYEDPECIGLDLSGCGQWVHMDLNSTNNETSPDLSGRVPHRWYIQKNDAANTH